MLVYVSTVFAESFFALSTIFNLFLKKLHILIIGIITLCIETFENAIC